MSFLLLAALVRAATYGVGIYQGVGVPVSVSIELTPGNGTIYVPGYTASSDFLYSAKVAIWEAALNAGVQPWRYNYIIEIKPLGNMSTYIGGPSLSLTIYLEALNVFTGRQGNSSIAYSGAVGPGGVVDLVGNIREKALGLQNSGFKAFAFPVLELFTYRFELRPVYYGVYATVIRQLTAIPTNLTGVHIGLIEVGNVYQAAAVAQGLPYNITADLYALDLKINASHINYSGFAAPALSLLKNETATLINGTLDAMKALNIQGGTYLDLVRQALAYLEAGERTPDLRPELWVQAYGTAATAYYYLLLLYNNTRAVREMEVRYYALLSVAVEAQKFVKPDLQNLCEAAYSRMYLHLANQSLDQLKAYLDYYLWTGSPTYAAAAVYTYATITEYLWRSIIYASFAANGSGVDLNATYNRFTDYLNAVVRYAELYSEETNIYSTQLVGGAETNYYRMLETDDRLAALGYGTEALAYAMAYFAIHPGYPNTTAVKYAFFADSAYHKLGRLTYTQIVDLKTASLAELNETRVLYLSRALACEYLREFAEPGPAVEAASASTTTLPTPNSENTGGLWALAVGIAACMGACLGVLERRRRPD
ncbi:MAG: hypothetical protein QXP98_07705 [Thermoproteus sp.]